MEHLFLDVSLDVGQEKILGALKDLPLKETDPQSKLALVPPVKPFTRWFGYDHDAGAPLNNGDPHKPQPFWGYAKKRGWDLAPFFGKAGGDPARSHPSLQVPGMTCQLMSQKVAAFLQSWLYFGFIESFVWIPIHTSYLLRRDPATGYQYIHTGNLNFIIMIFKALPKYQDDLEWKEKLTRASEDTLNQVGEAIELVKEFAHTVSLFPNSPFSELIGAIAHFLPSVIRLRDACKSLCYTSMVYKTRLTFTQSSTPEPMLFWMNFTTVTCSAADTRLMRKLAGSACFGGDGVLSCSRSTNRQRSPY